MTQLSRTEMRRLAHRISAGFIEGGLGAGWEIETYLPTYDPATREPTMDSPEAQRLHRAILAIVAKLYDIGERF